MCGVYNPRHLLFFGYSPLVEIFYLYGVFPGSESNLQNNGKPNYLVLEQTRASYIHIVV